MGDKVNYYGIKRKWVHTAADLPEGDHYAVIEFGTIHVPADGPGYPACTEPYIRYIVFPSKEEWQKEIEWRTIHDTSAYKPPFMACKIVRASVETHIRVQIEGI